MEHKLKRALIAALVSGSITVPITSHATNGVFMIGYGGKSVAVGGVAIANPQDSLASAANPAAASVAGNRFDIGIDFFRPEAYAVLADLYQPSVATTIFNGAPYGWLRPKKKAHNAGVRPHMRLP